MTFHSFTFSLSGLQAISSSLYNTRSITCGVCAGKCRQNCTLKQVLTHMLFFVNLIRNFLLSRLHQQVSLLIFQCAASIDRFNIQQVDDPGDLAIIVVIEVLHFYRAEPLPFRLDICHRQAAHQQWKNLIEERPRTKAPSTSFGSCTPPAVESIN